MLEHKSWKLYSLNNRVVFLNSVEEFGNGMKMSILKAKSKTNENNDSQEKKKIRICL